ncbi:GtrA family protein [Phytohabitans houttuyneae]|uniref:GtrA-like protein domain-containing protein n=1 Tax=Phytohabitans houttuyneae TaxID=1076126 RepID=A0A6V8KFV3_9ACTN|nr:GtrA family protein [Phytohabitans houttuyneae]GFJ81371.1 hypothetical protein Phou_055510 [Phytohabitans houttuyneae]
MQQFDTPAPAAVGPFGSFVRFVMFGGGVGLACSAAVPLVATLMPWVIANALITVASTLLCTELHARFTFGAGRRAQWHQHVQSASSALAAYLVTSAAVLVLHAVQPSAGMRWEQAVYLSASALAGIGRFLVLRLYVFARGRAAGTDLDGPWRPADREVAGSAPAAGRGGSACGGKRPILKGHLGHSTRDAGHRPRRLRRWSVVPRAPWQRYSSSRSRGSAPRRPRPVRRRP